MIRFSFGAGDVAVRGYYTVDDGVVITTDNADGLAEILQTEIEVIAQYGAYSWVDGHPWAGRYAIAERVLEKFGATRIDTSEVPEQASGEVTF